MRTTRIVMLVTLLVTFSSSVPVLADPHPDARIGVLPGGCVRPNLDVYVWPDRGVDAMYYPGDPISILFEVTRDCYVVIYDLDTRGRMHILFPFDPWQDNFVQAGQIYEIPGSWDDFSLTVEGPPGDEFIQAVASPYPFDLPDWPVYINSPGQYPETCTDPDLLDFRAGDDRVGYIQRVNRKVARHHWDWCATDLARFYVHPRPYPPRFSVQLGGWWDPWPDDFYGAVYIGWPIGSHIYVDGIFVGIAPCWVHGLSFGHHWVRAFDRDRLVCEKQVRYRHKQAYRTDYPDYRLKGTPGKDIYRTAPKAGPAVIEKRHADNPTGKMRDKTRVRDSEPSEKVRPRIDNARLPAGDPRDRPARRVPEVFEKKQGSPPDARREKSAGERKPGKLERVLSSAGRVLGQVVDKPEPAKERSGKAEGPRVGAKAGRSEPAKAAKADRAARASKKR